MFRKKVLTGLVLGLLLVGQTTVYAEAVGQVTIVNVDKTDANIRLNGAQIKIISQDTGTEYKDTIAFNGTVIFELPLGKYYVQQLTPPDDSYELNTEQYEFVLQIPEGANPDNVKSVNAPVTLANQKLDSEAPPVPDEQPAATPLSPSSAAASAKNPQTADFSWVVLSVTGLSIAAVGVIVWFIRRLRQY